MIQMLDDSILRSIIEKAVQKKHNSKPRFYVVGGSHIYGFPSDEGGDIDVRGFHTTDWKKYATLNPPEEQIMVNQGGVTEGFESHPEVDLVSYELRKFGYLLSKMNFNVLEWFSNGKIVMNGVPLSIDSLKEIIGEELPGEVAHHYRGMAKSNYKKFLDKNRESYKPTAKKFLYVIRGLLGAEYVSKEEEIEADINNLASELLDKSGIKTVKRLIEVKNEDENIEAPDELKERGHDLIKDLFDELEIKVDGSRERLKKKIDNWMLNLRGI